MNNATTTCKTIKAGYKNPSAACALSLILSMFCSAFCMTSTTCLAQQQYLVPPPLVAGDSTIPPEVVPMTAPPAPAGANGVVPGLVSPELTGAGPANALDGMQTAQQARQTALNSLMGNQQWSPQLNEELQAQANARAAAMAAAQPNAANNNMAAAQPGLTGQIAMQQNAGATDPSETQTLTGGVKYQQYYQNTQRSGFTNAASSSVGLMAGYANPSNISTLGAASGLGLPFYLLGATGLGIRNGFRW